MSGRALGFAVVVVISGMALPAVSQVGATSATATKTTTATTSTPALSATGTATETTTATPTTGPASATEAASAASTLTADNILERADEIRSPSSSYQMEVEVESSDGGISRFQVDIGGIDATVIKSKAPAREVGKNFLMLGPDMWAYLPNIRRSVRVALNQKLSGQAANGDISRMRWRGDYTPQIESQDDKAWVLMLKAKGPGTTYDSIRVWINKENFRPIKGEFLTSAGRPLKRITYDDYRDIGGGIRPTTMRIESADKAGDYSILKIQTMREKQFPSSYFTQSSLQ